MGIEFNAREFAKEGEEKIISDVIGLRANGISAKLDAIIVGDNDPSIRYAKMKANAAKRLGVGFELHKFGFEVSQQEVEDLIVNLNLKSSVHGILIEHPTPNMDYDDLMTILLESKDLDGLNPNNLGALMRHHKITMNKNEKGIMVPSDILDRSGKVLLPATPLACLSILDKLLGGDIEGKRITLVGLGETVGGPLQRLLGFLGATVTGCNIGTRQEDLESSCRNAEVIITAVGKKPEDRQFLITPDMVSPRQIIIDAAMIGTSTGVQGDVDYEGVKGIVDYCTPVPGGVGPNTLVQIYMNLIQAILLQYDGLKYPLEDNYN